MCINTYYIKFEFLYAVTHAQVPNSSVKQFFTKATKVTILNSMGLHCSFMSIILLRVYYQSNGIQSSSAALITAQVIVYKRLGGLLQISYVHATNCMVTCVTRNIGKKTLVN